MPIELPVLDDKRYADLMEEARTSIPRLYPGWTDHNPSDPGMTLVELFAWLTDILIYRVGRLPDERILAFLRLLCGPDFALAKGEVIEDGIRRALGAVRERWRAVSADDYEFLTMRSWPRTEPAASLERIARVRCIPERNLGAADKLAPAPGYISVIIAPAPEDASPWAQPSPALLEGLSAFFEPRRLLTTRVCLVGPSYVPVSITATIYLNDSGVASQVRPNAVAALQRFLDPFAGGDDERGFPFGGEAKISKLNAILEGVRGVDFTEGVSIAADDGDSRAVKDGDELLAIELKEHELPRLDAKNIHLTLMTRSGDKWKVV